jgi:hypothetical protein
MYVGLTKEQTYKTFLLFYNFREAKWSHIRGGIKFPEKILTLSLSY